METKREAISHKTFYHRSYAYTANKILDNLTPFIGSKKIKIFRDIL